MCFWYSGNRILRASLIMKNETKHLPHKVETIINFRKAETFGLDNAYIVNALKGIGILLHQFKNSVTRLDHVHSDLIGALLSLQDLRSA
ncbi:hypothetical protein TNIN_34791 [Trichonephila inaurata madagascariensis]|uniref:Uncharacterized protein n=1 Tax=Trichonephila inaurata madagascariensis TaxID=2747483 RepID=A0A8X6XCY8_9ARAC|nr:hypothetical protein TNIN_34791 [Trichonephila inaurata madagascariensis]